MSQILGGLSDRMPNRLDPVIDVAYLHTILLKFMVIPIVNVYLVISRTSHPHCDLRLLCRGDTEKVVYHPIQTLLSRLRKA